MLNGDFGPGVQKAMTLLVRYGQAFGADRMARVSGAHLHFHLPLDLLTDMTEGIDKLRVPSTLGPGSDPESYKTLGIGPLKPGTLMRDEPATMKAYQERLRIFRRLGVMPTFTCTTYLMGIVPIIGNVVTAIGTSEQVVLNSLFGIRANSEGASSALASAITGCTPRMGLLLDEERYAKVLVELDKLDFKKLTDADYSAIGYVAGGHAGNRPVAINGVPPDISFEQTRALVSAVKVKGATIMAHIIGLTPEAATLEQAFGNRQPEKTVKISMKDIIEARESLNTAKSADLELVSLGCSHCTVSEIQQVASLLKGKKINSRVRFMIGAARPVVSFARQLGLAGTIERAGGVFTDCCVAVSNPVLHLGNIPKVAATNSAKAAERQANVTKGKTGLLFGSTETCVKSAIAGRWLG